MLRISAARLALVTSSYQHVPRVPCHPQQACSFLVASVSGLAVEVGVGDL